MENKINIAELLRDCPKGMELECLLCNNPIELEGVAGDDAGYPIKAVGKDGFYHVFTSYGASYNHDDVKCVIFPKGKTTWEGFQRPFKDGDIVITTLGNTAIIKEPAAIEYFAHCILVGAHLHTVPVIVCVERFATEEEKQKLFDAIKKSGYKWNAENKALEELIEPKFKVGDWIVTTYDKVNQVVSVDKDGDGYTLDDGVYFSGSWCDMYHLWTIQDAKEGDVLVASDGSIFLFAGVFDCACKYYAALTACNTVKINKEVYDSYWETSRAVYPATKEQRDLLFTKMKEAGYEWDAETKTLEELPKFKIGDRIKNKDNCRSSIVAAIRDNCFIIKTLDGLHHSYLTDKIPFSKQVEYELVTDKFNINTLKPFDKVLVRGNVGQKWTHDFFGFMDNDKGFPFVCVGHYVIQCVPYEGNEHLLGTTNDCNEFYKTWK